MLPNATRLIPVFKSGQQSKRRTVRGLAGMILIAWMLKAHAADNMAENPDLDYLALQIKSAEADQARSTLERIVADIQLDQGRYAHALVEPLTLLGDAQMVLENPRAAEDHYAHALHLSRSNQGLFAPEQVDIVYRQATLHTAAGNLSAARQREEYAFEVLQRHYGQASLDLLPAIKRLGEFYQRSFNFLGARVLFKQALAILEVQDGLSNEAAIPYLQGIAKTYLTERFPPFYSESQFDSRAQSGLREMDLSSEYISISNYPAGERALQSVVTIRQQSVDRALMDPDLSDQENAARSAALQAAMLDLADWHQLFGHIREARVLYTHLYKENDANERALVTFDEPKLLYFPQPKNPKRPSDFRRQAASGEVELRFDVLPSGRIRNLETVTSIPEGLMDFQVRRNIRDAVFRPAINAEGPFVREGFGYRYEFDHYPKLAPVESDSVTTDPSDSAQEQAP